MVFPSPHPGIINFFQGQADADCYGWCVSVPSSGDYQFLHAARCLTFCDHGVSVPSSGDYQFLRFSGPHLRIGGEVSVPSSGDYQFLLGTVRRCRNPEYSFRPLIRGLSISSDQQSESDSQSQSFPSPHPGIINFFVI